MGSMRRVRDPSGLVFFGFDNPKTIQPGMQMSYGSGADECAWSRHADPDPFWLALT
jgi:hypothetical protein